MQDNPTTTRRCPRCKTDKHLSDFGKQGYCRSCRKEYASEYAAKQRVKRGYAPRKPKNVDPKPKTPAKKREVTPEQRERASDAYYRRTYGVGVDFIDGMSVAQGNCCAICHEPEPNEGRRLRVLRADDSDTVHCLICSQCSSVKNALHAIENYQGKFEAVRDFLKRLPQNSESAS